MMQTNGHCKKSQKAVDTKQDKTEAQFQFPAPTTTRFGPKFIREAGLVTIPHLSDLWSRKLRPLIFNCCYKSDRAYSCFSDFVFKIWLIRLGFSSQKNKKFLYLFELTTYRLSVRSLNHYTTEPTVSKRHKQLSVAFSHAWLILVEFT